MALGIYAIHIEIYRYKPLKNSCIVFHMDTYFNCVSIPQSTDIYTVSFFILTTMLQWTFLYIWVPHTYISISTGLTPKSVIVGLKGMCIKIQNPATNSLEYISSQNLTCITLDIINLKFLLAFLVKNGNSLFCMSEIVSDSENLFLL